MILTTLLIGAAVVAMLSVFWEDIKKFLIKGTEKVRQMLNTEVYGSKISILKAGESEYVETSRHYVRKESHWHETTIKRKVPPDKIPKDILEQVGYNSELDLTEQFNKELALALSNG